jgi:hypothetical protein
MHSANDAFVIALAAAALCACGNYSNDDLVFISAIPSRGQLQVSVPKAAGQALCALGEATYATNAQTQGKGVNQGIDNILGLIDFIRSVPATVRDGDSRYWGPWRDDKHAHVDYQVSMRRTRAEGGLPANDKFDYLLSGRLDGGAWVTLLSGVFNGSQAQHGTGALRLDFEGAYQLGTNGADDPHGAIQVAYSLGGDPRTIGLQLTAAPGFGLSVYHYVFAGYADGRALFDFQFNDTSGNVFTVDARFTVKGDGRASITGTAPNGDTAHIDSCFDGQACITWLDDIHGFTPACNGRAFCKLGSQAACPAGTP